MTFWAPYWPRADGNSLSFLDVPHLFWRLKGGHQQNAGTRIKPAKPSSAWIKDTRTWVVKHGNLLSWFNAGSCCCISHVQLCSHLYIACTYMYIRIWKYSICIYMLNLRTDTPLTRFCVFLIYMYPPVLQHNNGKSTICSRSEKLLC